jgi:restriction system protein
MEAYGFVDVEITDVGPDGGIDGFGKIRLGLATINAAFQCKRWKGNVGRTEVDKFRGAIQGEYEQGVFFTTSEFTNQAKEASIRKGAVPVILLNGSSMVDIMIEKELGVRAQPIQLYQPTFSDFELD